MVRQAVGDTELKSFQKVGVDGLQGRLPSKSLGRIAGANLARGHNRRAAY